MTRVYIGGKRVTKEELANYEIRSEKVKRIVADKFSIKQKQQLIAQ